MPKKMTKRLTINSLGLELFNNDRQL